MHIIEIIIAISRQHLWIEIMLDVNLKSQLCFFQTNFIFRFQNRKWKEDSFFFESWKMKNPKKRDQKRFYLLASSSYLISYIAKKQKKISKTEEPKSKKALVSWEKKKNPNQIRIRTLWSGILEKKEEEINKNLMWCDFFVLWFSIILFEMWKMCNMIFFFNNIWNKSRERQIRYTNQMSSNE